MSSDNSESPENICVVCFKNVEIYSIGSCDHMVCYECSTRMRVLCRQNECPICRQDLPRVVFTCTVKPFNDINNCSSLEDKKFKIGFETKKIQSAFYKLLEHSCSVCPNSPTFKTFQNLYDHMKKEHDLYYCDLCIEHLKIFTSERQCYTIKNLEQHKRKGDADDRSHRGHPLCRFCDIRFMDNDWLYRHLRKDHFFCHFCDADGHDLYFSSYNYLREHFRTEHYLCEEGSCVDEEFTPVFRTHIDLKAHKALAHSRSLGKAAAKQARTLELEFTLKPRPRPHAISRRGRSRLNDANSEEATGGQELEQPSLHPVSPNLDPSQFPSLPSGPGSVPLILPQQRGRSGGLTIHAVGRRNAPLAINDENFPVLGVYNDSSAPGTSVRLNINQERSELGKTGNTTPRNVSIHVNHRANGEKNIRIRQDDFPALTSDKTPQSTSSAAKWSCITNKKPAAAPSNSSTVSKPPKKLLNNNDFPSLNSKFSANLNLKTNEPTKPNFVNIKTYRENKVDEQRGKKASSVTIPVQNNWDETSAVEEAYGSGLKTKSKKKKSKGSNVEEKSDTAKKKQIVKEAENKLEGIEGSSEESSKSALSVTNTKNVGNVTIKPLPTAEDWFDGLKKNKNESSDAKSQEINTEVSSGTTKLKVKNSSKTMDFECSGFNNNNNNNNNNNSNNTDTGNDTDTSSKILVSKKFDTKAPPGFDNYINHVSNNDVKKPPPGFSVGFPRSNGLTFTNSSGQSYAISTDFDYTPPVDFESRNQNLILKVNKIILNDVNLEQFRKMSVLFRQNMLSANDYYDHCTKTMGEKNLQEVFPELLVLLPDINKQQELYQVYSQTQNFSKAAKNLTICSTCRQVLSNSDKNQHSAQHSIQQNFPVLMTDEWTK